MSVSESERYQIFQWMEEAMGPERAAVMMELLPPVGWGDIATRTDLGALRSELKGDIARLEGQIGLLEGKMEHGFGRMQKTVYVAMLASNATVAGLVLAALRVA